MLIAMFAGCKMWSILFAFFGVVMLYSLDSIALIFIFAGFHCPDFHIRWIQLVADFLLHFFVAFAVALIVHRGSFAFEDYLYRALRLICIFAGFNCFAFHICWIPLS